MEVSATNLTAGATGGKVAAPAERRAVAAASPRLPGSTADTPQAAKVSASPVDVPDPQQLAETLQQIVESVLDNPADLKFSVDDATGRIIIRVVDPESGEVTRQIPADEILEVARRLAEKAKGAILDSRA